MNGTLLRPAAILVAAVLFLALQLLVDTTLTGARLDLTENQLYTLTDGSRNIAGQLDEPMTLQLHVSSAQAAEIPLIETYATRVRELLEEYVAASDGMLRLELYDPEPFSEEEDLAVGAGLRGLPINGAGDLLYFGLVVSNAVGEVETIPFFDPSKEALLEYEVSRLIHQLGSPSLPVVGILSGLPIQGGPVGPPPGPGQPPAMDPPWFVVQQLQGQFEVRDLSSADTELPDDLDVLMLVHPRGLSDELLYAIDQFVLAGGSALVFVDPHSEEQARAAGQGNPMAAMEPSSSDLPALFQAWGVSYDSESVVLDMEAAMPVLVRDAQGRPRQAGHVAWLDLPRTAFASTEPATSGLGAVTLVSTGSLGAAEGASTTFTPLLRSGPQSMEIASARLRFMPDVEGMLRDYAAEGGERTLAARVMGPARTAFPGGLDAPDAEAADGDADAEVGSDGARADGEHLEESVDGIHVVVVADTDLLADSWWVEFGTLAGQRVALPTRDNGALVVNALDVLGGGSDLIDVRSRGQFQRPFTRLDDLRREAELAFLDKEQALLAELDAIDERLVQLQRERDDASSGRLLSDEQEAELERSLDLQIETRKELRTVRHELRKDIESTQAWLKFVNILGVPLLLLLASAVSLVLRRKR